MGQGAGCERAGNRAGRDHSDSASARGERQRSRLAGLTRLQKLAQKQSSVERGCDRRLKVVSSIPGAPNCVWKGKSQRTAGALIEVRELQNLDDGRRKRLDKGKTGREGLRTFSR